MTQRKLRQCEAKNLQEEPEEGDDFKLPLSIEHTVEHTMSDSDMEPKGVVVAAEVRLTW